MRADLMTGVTFPGVENMSDERERAFEAWRSVGYKNRHEIAAEIAVSNERLGHYQFQIDALDMLKDVHGQLGELLGINDGKDLSLKFERIETSRVPKFAAALREDKVGVLATKEFLAPKQAAGMHKMAMECEKIIVNNSYKKMIENKEELQDAEWHCPYNLSCFEFHIEANKKFMYFIIFMLDVDETKEYRVAVNVRKGKRDLWALVQYDVLEEDFPLVPVLKDEIRAICILMDADVIVQKQHRIAARYNDQRRHTEDLPEYEFKTISLRRSVQYEGDDMGNEEKRRSPRLHLRRGHWRRVGSYKTWVRWSVVGNAALGVIDKQYRA